MNRASKIVAVLCVAAAGLTALAAPTPALAWGRYYGGFGVGVATGAVLGLGLGGLAAPYFYGPPVVYAAPPVVYAPPPVYYAPPPVYYAAPLAAAPGVPGCAPGYVCAH